jgi:hypothetical protein
MAWRMLSSMAASLFKTFIIRNLKKKPPSLIIFSPKIIGLLICRRENIVNDLFRLLYKVNNGLSGVRAHRPIAPSPISYACLLLFKEDVCPPLMW